MSWTGCKTPPSGKTISYTVAVPYFDEVDLGRMCSRVHADLPEQSCVIAVDRNIRGRQVRAGSMPRPRMSPCAQIFINPFVCRGAMHGGSGYGLRMAQGVQLLALLHTTCREVTTTLTRRRSHLFHCGAACRSRRALVPLSQE